MASLFSLGSRRRLRRRDLQLSLIYETVISSCRQTAQGGVLTTDGYHAVSAGQRHPSAVNAHLGHTCVSAGHHGRYRFEVGPLLWPERRLLVRVAAGLRTASGEAPVALSFKRHTTL